MGLWILYFAITQKKYRQIRFWAQMGLFGLISLAMTGPIFYQYAKIHNEMGFVRGIDFYARLTSYLAAPPVNWLYGRITARFIVPEGELFPGIMAFVLATISIITLVKARERRAPEKQDEPKKSFYVIRRVLNILILMSAVIVIFIMGEGGLDLKIVGFKLIRAHNLGRLDPADHRDRISFRPDSLLHDSRQKGNPRLLSMVGGVAGARCSS